MDDKQLIPDVFEPYFRHLSKQEGAITYGEQLALIDKLEKDVLNGKVPVSPTNTITLPPSSPVVRSLADGRPIALGGDAETTRQNKPKLSKRVVLFGIVATLFMMIGGIVFLLTRTDETMPPEEEVTEIVMVEEDDFIEELLADITSPTEPSTPEPIPTSTPLPTIAPMATLPPPPRRVAEQAHEPTSLEIAGHVYPLAVASAVDVWRPKEPQWLEGTELRRVIGIPYDADVLNALLGTYDTIRLRLRGGEIVAYQLSDIRRVNRTQTELFSSVHPSIAIVMYYEEENDDPQRWVLVGDAIQEVDQAMYANALRPTPVANSTTIQLIDGRGVIADGIRLLTEPCAFANSLEGRPPVVSGQQFVSCPIIATGVGDTEIDPSIVVDVYLSEFEWLQDTAWQPQAVIVNQEEGENSIRWTLAGIVRQADGYPVLGWDRAGVRQLIPLQIEMPQE